MSRFKNEVTHLQAHVKTLRLGAAALFVVALLLGFGWWSAPKSLTIHVPPDLRSGSTRKWWDVPPESVYAFTFYIWQQAQRWPTNGEEDYPRNLHSLSAYLTPSCRSFLQQDYEFRRSNGELRQRVRGIYEIPGRGYGDDPTSRVQAVSASNWVVTLDVSADEYLGSEQVKRALLRAESRAHGRRPRAQPLRPCIGLLRERTAAHRAAIGPIARQPTRQCWISSAGGSPMKRLVLPALAGLLLSMGLISASQAVEILRWERLPLAVPLVVGQERVVFIDRNVRIGVPESIGEHLRVQGAGGAIYLRASEPIPPTRLQLQDVESGALILLDIAAEPAKAGQAPLEPVRIVEGDEPAGRRRDQAGDSANADEEPGPGTPTSTARRATPVSVVLTRYAAQNLYVPLRTVEPVAGIVRVSLRRNLALNSLLPTLPVRARALAAWRLEDQWVTAVRLTNTSARWLDLDPRALQGDFVAATYQHPTLGPAGRAADTTVVYLVTRGHGLAESLLPVVAPIDAMVNLPPAAAAGQAEGSRENEARDEK